MTVPLDDGTWLAFPEAGENEGEGGDCYGVAYFGDNELEALRYINLHRGYRAVLIKPGQTLLQAVKAQRG